MSKAEICDFCGKTILETFSDVAYKIKKIGHGYDGYQPFRHKWSVDICPNCMKNLTQGLAQQDTRSTRAKKGVQKNATASPTNYKKGR